MDDIRLVKPGPEHEPAAWAYRQEHFDHGETELHGAALLDQANTYEEWLQSIWRDPPAENWVAASTFFGVRERDGEIVGIIDVRHTLNDFLREVGGHIGYGVRPSQRGKGYATQMLRLALEYCREIGLDRVMLACYKDNAASSKTIEKCGGRLEREGVFEGKEVLVYWIGLH